MYNVMKILITKKYYATKEEAEAKLDVFFAMNRISEEEYVELIALVEAQEKEEQLLEEEYLEEALEEQEQ